MSEILKRANESAIQLDDLSHREFGAAIQVSEVSRLTPSDGLHTVTNHAIPGAELIPIGQNFNTLTKQIGNTYGILTQVNKRPVLYPGIITSRTTANRIHMTYLNDPLNPANLGELTDLQRVMLQGSLSLQDARVGTEHAHGNNKSVATELGHTVMAMRSLTDSGTMRALQSGSHIVHNWGHSAQGIAPTITKQADGTHGAFDMRTTRGGRAFTFDSIELNSRSSAILVRSPLFEQGLPHLDGTDVTKIMLGVGILAARQQHGKQTNELLTRSMSQL